MKNNYSTKIKISNCEICGAKVKVNELEKAIYYECKNCNVKRKIYKTKEAK